MRTTPRTYLCHVALVVLGAKSRREKKSVQPAQKLFPMDAVPVVAGKVLLLR